MLLRNEDRFLQQAIQNIIGFCDHLILLDHNSTDKTPEILSQYIKNPKCRVERILHPGESQSFLKPYYNTSTWAFGVDGDEIYDPKGLERFRKQILDGKYSDFWMILSNVLHVDFLDNQSQKAMGYLSPPSRSITKFYNFAAIQDWYGNIPERLHGGTINFHEGYDASKKHHLENENSWEQSDLRCLHTCFIPRSSLDKEQGAAVTTRKNIMETYAASPRDRFKNWLFKFFNRKEKDSQWKRERYQRGERIEVNISEFFPSQASK
ncbi:MAG: glycosyltransferase [Chthoniobacterales bacterium]